MKITSSKYDVQKELGVIDGTVFQLEEITNLVQRTYVKPGLLTALMTPQEEFMRTNTFVYDMVDRTVQLPNGKSYSEYGDDLSKDDGVQKRYGIPSFGLRYNVRPEDAIGLRKPGTMELMQPEDIQAEMAVKVIDGWDLFEELALAQLITTDTNITRGGPFTAVNFYTDIVGSARPAATSMQFATSTADHDGLARREARILRQELSRAGLSSSGMVVIAGDNFFDQKFEIEKAVDLARPLRYGPDFASNLQTSLDIAGFNYAMFESRDGLTYINYGSEIIGGTKLIDDDMAYLIPVGTNIVTKAYAPAVTLDTVNELAQRRYAWQTVSQRQGYAAWTESNVLYMNKQPRVIRHLTV